MIRKVLNIDYLKNIRVENLKNILKKDIIPTPIGDFLGQMRKILQSNVRQILVMKLLTYCMTLETVYIRNDLLISEDTKKSYNSEKSKIMIKNLYIIMKEELITKLLTYHLNLKTTQGKIGPVRSKMHLNKKQKLEYFKTVPASVQILTQANVTYKVFTNVLLKKSNSLNQAQISVDMGKRELNFQINYNLSSGVNYIDYFGKIRPIFNNLCGGYVHILVKQNGIENLLTDSFLEEFQVLNQVWISGDMGKKELNFQINYNLSSGVKYIDYLEV